MKLANALSLRSELQTRIRQLESRLDNNALVQEGESPAEDPMELLRELEEDYAQLEELIARINRTNSTTEAGEGRTLSDLLAQAGSAGQARAAHPAGLPEQRQRRGQPPDGG